MNPQQVAYEAMQEFDIYQRREWMIYAAKHQACPKCEVPAGQGCENLSKRKSGIVELVKNPHVERIDWDRLAQGLAERGHVEPEPLESPVETMPDWARPVATDVHT